MAVVPFLYAHAEHGAKRHGHLRSAAAWTRQGALIVPETGHFVPNAQRQARSAETLGTLSGSRASIRRQDDTTARLPERRNTSIFHNVHRQGSCSNMSHVSRIPQKSAVRGHTITKHRLEAAAKPTSRR